MKYILNNTLEYAVLFIWVLPGFIYLVRNKKDEFRFFFVLLMLSEIIVFILTSNEMFYQNTARYFFKYLMVLNFATLVNSKKMKYGFSLFLIVIFIFHLNTFFVYKQYLIEPYYYLIFDLGILYTFERIFLSELKKKFYVKIYLIVLSFFFFSEVLMQFFVIFKLYDFKLFMSAVLTIVAIYFTFASYEKPRPLHQLFKRKD